MFHKPSKGIRTRSETNQNIKAGQKFKLFLNWERKLKESEGPDLYWRLLWRWASEDYEKGYDVIRCEIKKKPLLLEYGEQIEIGSEM